MPNGAATAAPIFHPLRPQTELLGVGVHLEARTCRRLAELGVNSVWIQHDATADLDKLIPPDLGKARRAAYEQLKKDFTRLQQSTVSSGQIQVYRQVIMDLVCELIASRNVAGLTEHLLGGPSTLFTHGANVAYLSVLAGLELETYIVNQRTLLRAEYARDLTSLGVGAMLHDIGKLALDEGLRPLHQVHMPSPMPEDQADAFAAYRTHTLQGYEMLRGCRAPASATQVVLNHHQRWDGRGFPDMNEITRQRKSGTQTGSNIHIFSRITAVANTLDNLLTGAQDGRQPPAAALKALASDRFDGWFDPFVRDRMLRIFPPFAIGSHITLSDSRPGVVITPNLDQPCRPIVRLLSDACGDGQHTTIDLAEEEDLHIATCAGQNVEPHLFTLPPKLTQPPQPTDAQAAVPTLAG